MAAILKYTRRDFFMKLAYGGAGALGFSLALKQAGFAGMWDSIFAGKAWAEAYPEELHNIEKLTNGQVHVGDVITAENIELVKHLVPPSYIELVKKGLEIKVIESEFPVEWAAPDYWLKKTEENRGKAVLDENVTLWQDRPGSHWTGGWPFPDPKTGNEVIWDYMVRPLFREDDFNLDTVAFLLVNANGELERTLLVTGLVLNAIGRCAPSSPPETRPVFGDGATRAYLISMTKAPYDVRGGGVIKLDPLNSKELPILYAYSPTARRILRVPATQRYQSQQPGDDKYTAETGLFADPIGLWKWNLLEKKPLLLPIACRVDAYESAFEEIKQRSWTEASFQRQIQGQFIKGKYYRVEMRLRPEVYVLESIPGPEISDAPYSRRILYLDALVPVGLVAETYDRPGNLWKIQFRPHRYTADFATMGGKTIHTFGPSGLHTWDLQTGRASLEVYASWPRSANMGLGADTFAIPSLERRISAF